MQRIMKRMSAVGGLMVLAMAMAGCGPGISFSHDMDPSAGFSRFASYAWVQMPANAQNPRGVNPLIDARVTTAISAQLAAKGYQLATSGQPDFFVNFVITTSEQVDYNTYYTGMGYGYGRYGGMGMSSAHTTASVSTNGTLIVDVFDGQSKSLIWRGTAKGTVEPQASPEDRQVKIDYAVGGVLKDFPAKR